VGKSDVEFWNGASEVSGKTTTLPEGVKAGAEKEVGKSEVTFWNGASVVSGLGAKLPEGRIVPAEKGADAELDEDSLEEAVEITTLTNSVGPKNR
jgi:hypothetical protein